MEKGTDGQTDKTDGWTKGLMDRQLMDKQKVMDTDIRHTVNGQMNKQMDRGSDRQTDRQIWMDK